MQTVNIIAVPNGVGISRDIKLIQDVLVAAGHKVYTRHTYQWRPSPTERSDLAIHLERFRPELFQNASCNVMIPNQEWFEESWLQHLKAFDAIFTKSKFADEVFKKLGCVTRFISFTSEDRFLDNVKKDEMHWLHVAGKSVQKQTEIVLRTWAKNPGFPHLTILQDPKFYRPRMVLRNVNYCYDRVSDDFLKVMQNTSGVHVCPSETEGFGHYIAEAMSCRAIVITTDGAPMNELITPDRGILCNAARSEPLRLSRRFIINEETLERAVVQTMVLDDGKRKEIREKARQHFIDNNAMFRVRLTEAVAELLEKKV